MPPQTKTADAKLPPPPEKPPSPAAMSDDDDDGAAAPARHVVPPPPPPSMAAAAAPAPPAVEPGARVEEIRDTPEGRTAYRDPATGGVTVVLEPPK